MPRQVSNFEIKFRVRDVAHYSIDSMLAKHRTRRTFLEEIVEFIEAHSKARGLVIESTITAHDHEVRHSG